jgi:hypothetical protein
MSTQLREPCRLCGTPYERDPAVQERWSRTRPETDGLCLSCIGRMGNEKAMEEG